MEMDLAPALVPGNLIKDLVKDVKTPAALSHMKLTLVKTITTATGMIKPRPLISNNPR
jgi:hypothetical protein